MPLATLLFLQFHVPESKDTLHFACKSPPRHAYLHRLLVVLGTGISCFVLRCDLHLIMLLRRGVSLEVNWLILDTSVGAFRCDLWVYLPTAGRQQGYPVDTDIHVPMDILQLITKLCDIYSGRLVTNSYQLISRNPLKRRFPHGLLPHIMDIYLSGGNFRRPDESRRGHTFVAYTDILRLLHHL